MINSDVEITVEKVRSAAHALAHLNPSAEEICWALGIHNPSQAQIEIAEKIIQQENL